MSPKIGKKTLILLVLAAVLVVSAIIAWRQRQDILAAARRWKQGPIPAAVSRQDFIRDKAADTGTAPADTADITVPAGAPAAETTEGEGVSVPDTIPPETQITVGSDNDPTSPEGPAATPPSAPASLPNEINLEVPMVYQSPFGEWTALDDDACEEAAMLMLQAFYQGRTLTRQEMRDEIQALVDYQMMTLGYFEDTDADQTAEIMTDFLGVPNVRVVPISSLEDVKREIASGRPVILPAWGKALKNPYFRGGGPPFHMLVAKGYTATHIITNDPGTRHGADFLYTNSTMWDAIHDWNGGQVNIGRKVMITAGD